MATVLSLCQSVAKECGFDAPTGIVGSTDPTAAQLLELLNREGQHLHRRRGWTACQYEHLFTTSASQTQYALPDDFSRQIDQTHWNRGTHWPLIGPLTPSEWQQVKSGVISSYPRQRYRIWGNSASKLYIDPTPSTAESLVFEYISYGWVTAKQWVTGTVYAASATVSNNGNRYTTTAGGTAGATDPTHTSGSASDGGVTWVFADHGYATAVADTDIFILDEFLIQLGVAWRFLEAKGLDYTAKLAEYKAEVDKSIARDGGARPLMLANYGSRRLLSPWSTRDGNFGS